MRKFFSFDHIFPGTENHTLTAVLYGQLGSAESKQFHIYLKKLAEAGKIKYVSRHYVRVSI